MDQQVINETPYRLQHSARLPAESSTPSKRASVARAAVLLNDSRNFGDIQCPMWRRLDPAAGSGDSVVWIFPVGWVYGG
jgi:hypothetical protein